MVVVVAVADRRDRDKFRVSNRIASEGFRSTCEDCRFKGTDWGETLRHVWRSPGHRLTTREWSDSSVTLLPIGQYEPSSKFSPGLYSSRQHVTEGDQ